MCLSKKRGERQTWRKERDRDDNRLRATLKSLCPRKTVGKGKVISIGPRKLKGVITSGWRVLHLPGTYCEYTPIKIQPSSGQEQGRQGEAESLAAFQKGPPGPSFPFWASICRGEKLWY